MIIGGAYYYNTQKDANDKTDDKTDANDKTDDKKDEPAATLTPIDCNVSEWSEWADCSKACGGGTQERTRTVKTAAANGGAECGALSESQACNEQDCGMVKSIELHEIPPHGAVSSDGGDGVMNIKEIQLWTRTSSGLSNVARTGLPKLLQGIADKYFAWAGIDKINNGLINEKGFLFTTIPIGPAGRPATETNGIIYDKAAEYPIVKITLSTAVPMDEIVSAVIWNRSDGALGRLGKDLLVLRGDDGKVISQVQLPKGSMMKKYVRVDYKSVKTNEETDELINEYIVEGGDVAKFMAKDLDTTITPKYIQ